LGIPKLVLSLFQKQKNMELKFITFHKDYFLLVDEEAQWESPDYIIRNNGHILQAYDNIWEIIGTELQLAKKIVGHLPLNNAPALEGVPLLDDIKYCMKNTEANIEWLRQQGYEQRSGTTRYERPYLIVIENKKWFWEDAHNNNLPELSKQDVLAELEGLMEELPVDWLGTGGLGSKPDKEAKEWEEKWDAVYKSASQRRYTEEDMKKSFEAGQNYAEVMGVGEPNFKTFLQSLSPVTLPVGFEPEYDYNKIWDYERKRGSIGFKTIKMIKDKMFL
jgi:hypothetical protein